MLELSESEEARALELHRDSAVVDLHSDVPLMDISIRRFAGEREVMHNLVVPRMKRGGVDLAVSVVMADGGRLYPWGYDRFKVEYHGAAREALEVLDGMFAEEEESDDVWILARTFADIERAVSEDKVALLLSLEGGERWRAALRCSAPIIDWDCGSSPSRTMPAINWATAGASVELAEG